jgi:hypothetical protein
MKAKTITLTKTCEYCKTGVTFKNKENTEKHFHEHNGLQTIIK